MHTTSTAPHATVCAHPSSTVRACKMLCVGGLMAALSVVGLQASAQTTPPNRAPLGAKRPIEPTASPAVKPQVASARASTHLTLGDLFRQALTFDKPYQASLAQHQANLEGKNQALAALLPNLGFTAQIQKDDIQRSAFGQTVNTSAKPRAYSLNLRQALFQPKAWVSFKQAELANQASALSIQNARQDLLIRVAQAYFDVLVAEDTLRTLDAQQQAVKQQLESAKRNFEVGTTTITDQQEAQARFDLITAQQLGAENQKQVALVSLEAITGPLAKPLATLPAGVALQPPQPARLDDWAQRASTQNLQVLQAELQQQITQRELSKAKYGHLPTLDLTGQVLDARQQVFDPASGRPFDVNQQSNSVGLVLNVPLFSGGLTQSQVRQQAALATKSTADQENARLQATRAAKAAFLSLQSGLAQVKALETAVKSSELALSANLTGYDVGVRINIDVLNAQQQLVSAKQNLFKAQYDTLLASLRLQAATGQLDDQALDAITGLFVRP